MTGYYAFLDDSSIVTEIFIVVNDAEYIQGKKAEDYYAELRNQNCKKTCDTGCFRKVMAQVGGSYDSQLDAFIPRKPFPSWIFNSETWKWESSVEYPSDGLHYKWDEVAMQWVLRDNT
jgi:hypothetical protein